MVITIGLTGNVACGKSTVASYWGRCGCLVLDTDQMGAAALAPGTPGYRQVLETFSEHRDDLVMPDGQLNRRNLGRVVFGDRSKKRQLERIVWPKVYSQLFRALMKTFFTGFLRSDVVLVVEIPQLFESGSFTRKIFDTIVVVSCEPPEEQLSRLMKRNPDIPEEDARTRLSAQMPLAKKRRLANHVIDNSQNIEITHKQADEVLLTVKQNYKARRFRRVCLAFAATVISIAFFYYSF